MQSYKKYFHRLPSPIIAHTPSQLEDENLKLQKEIASNVCQFNENEKKAESLLDVLDEVRTPLQFYCNSPSHSIRRFFESGNAFRQMA